MKKTILLAFTICLFGLGSTYAQDKTPPPDAKQDTTMHKKKHMDKGEDRYKDLNLTPEQKVKVDAIDKEQKQKIKALRADNSLTEEAKKEQMKAISKERIEKLKPILTKEQKQILAEKKKKQTEE